MQIPVNHLWLNWKKSQKDFEQNFARLQERIKTEAIHDIRVAIKKLRAYLELYRQLKKEPDYDYLFQGTGELFLTLGRYRDIEICISLIKELEKETTQSAKEFCNYLQFLLKTTRAWANQELHRYHQKELAKIAFLFKQDESLTDLVSFCHDLELIIREKLNETKKHFRQPHQLRKNLKEVYYWIALFPGENAVPDWHQQALHSILDDLGDWQNLSILEIRLKHFRKDYLPKPFYEYQQLKDFHTRISNKKKWLLDNARRKTRGWLKKVEEKEKSEG